MVEAVTVLEAAWAGGAATSRLVRRAALQGTQVHPADLDGALQSSSLLARASQDGTTRLPFAVDKALLRGQAAGLLWVLVVGQGKEAADVSLAASGEGRAQLEGFCSRAFSAHASAQSLTHSHDARHRPRLTELWYVVCSCTVYGPEEPRRQAICDRV